MPSSSNPLSFRQNPWVYLFLFLISNTLISYSPLPLDAKLILGLVGIALPLYIALRTLASSRNEKPGYLSDLKFLIPVWLWAIGLFALAFLRFYKLETFPLWPNLDEGWIGTLAIELSKQWTWRFFYTFGEAPPLTIWSVACLFKLGFSPSFSLWFPPAVVSLLTVFVAYFAARQFFSKSFSLVCGGLMAFSYWSLMIGRLCHQGIWLPLWVCLCFYLLGGFQKARSVPEKTRWALGLGVGTGLGSFIFTPWPVPAGLLVAGLLWHWVIQSKENRRYFLFFCTSLAFTLIPFCLAVMREGYGSHIRSLTPWGGWFRDFNLCTSFFKYLAVLIWDSYEKDPAYTPVWGGFLNPLLGAFFFVGLIEMFRLRRFGLIRCVAVAFLLFLFPGALSPNLETFRIAQVLPLLLFLTALGIHALVGLLPSSKRLWILVSLFAITGAFDFNLLAAPFRNPEAHPENFGRPLKSLERYRTFQILDAIQKGRSKPEDIFILTDLDTNSFNEPTLSAMTYSFNAARDSDLFMGYPRWTAVFVNIHYQNFLKDRFPEGRWFKVSKDLYLSNGGDMLGLIPFTKSNSQTLGFWNQANAVFEKADLQRFNQGGGHIEKILKTLESAYPLVKGDPFLESVYWDKRAAFEYEDLNYEEQLRSYQMAVSLGYPSADLYYKLGQLLMVKQRYPGAQEAFLKATQAPLNLTQAHAALEWLKAQPPTNPTNNSK